MTDQSVIYMQNWLISTIMSVKLWANNYRGEYERGMNKKEQEQEEQHPRFLIHFEGCGHQRIVDTSTLMNPYASDPTMRRGNYHLCMHCFHEKRGHCEISLYHKAAVIQYLNRKDYGCSRRRTTQS